MTYASTSNGLTTTRFDVAVAGELITHVSGPAGIQRNDNEVTANFWSFTYDVPLPQVSDMGAVLYVGDHEYACSIAPLP
jgi:hypothetical protein